jgi:hypothetical protein
MTTVHALPTDVREVPEQLREIFEVEHLAAPGGRVSAAGSGRRSAPTAPCAPARCLAARTRASPVSGGVLGERLVDPQPDLAARCHLALDEVRLDQLLRDAESIAVLLPLVLQARDEYAEGTRPLPSWRPAPGSALRGRTAIGERRCADNFDRATRVPPGLRHGRTWSNRLMTPPDARRSPPAAP